MENETIARKKVGVDEIRLKRCG